jgi:hypothetical protein
MPSTPKNIVKAMPNSERIKSVLILDSSGVGFVSRRYVDSGPAEYFSKRVCVARNPKTITEVSAHVLARARRHGFNSERRLHVWQVRISCRARARPMLSEGEGTGIAGQDHR